VYAFAAFEWSFVALPRVDVRSFLASQHAALEQAFILRLRN
jgi:hypothetical protein